MTQGRVRQFLFPDAAERDPLFVQEILRLSHVGLRVIALIEVVMPVLLLLQHELLSDAAVAPTLPVAAAAGLMAIGAATWIAANREWSYSRCRELAWISAFLVAATVVVASIHTASAYAGADHLIPGRLGLVMIVGVALAPFRPIQMFGLGAALGAAFWCASWVARRGNALPGIGFYDHSALFTLTLLCTVLTAVLYRERWQSFQVSMRVLQASQDLREAQSQGLQSENAVQMGRLAAAVSHELNTPLGALKSGVQTLLVLAARQATGTASPAQQERFVRLQADCYRSISESACRIEAIVGRLQRFTNLDQAELQSADINQLLQDAVALLDPELRSRAAIEFSLAQAPKLVCRPQQLSGVFANLLSNAITASPANGGITVSTRAVEGKIEIVIQDQGRGMAAGEAGRVFDPGFKVSGGRVAAGNWGLFHARQVVREQGGDIRIWSQEQKGTAVTITLPY
jgi:signal transduction histidine kinase